MTNAANDGTQLFMALEGMLSAVVQQLTPMSRRRLTRTLAGGLRKRQSTRIKQQRNPDGTPFAPRKVREVKTYVGHLRFLWNSGHGNQVREISNWYYSKGDRGEKIITGYDADAGGFRSFKKEDIEQYIAIDLNKTAIRRTLRKGLMFQRIRSYRYLQMQASSDEARVGFQGPAGAIARIHQFGLVDTLGGHFRGKYPARQLLGLSDDDLAWIAETINAHLSQKPA
ncbi:phage virion morphogenesis protein [Serratia marcescens]|uniref:phage virion morphogenesis protein n=1 Tax=Serratia marcescens TaxID=615 RepID=UPI0024C4D8D7|nr:phage virion morphogenesis protein [Serratia marcescens]MDK1707011.1 phage virion morphogenesis protein [Serratia marcescens]